MNCFLLALVVAVCYGNRYRFINQNTQPITAPYHIVIARKNQALLSFLNIKVIVNGQEIYPLLTTKPIVIPVMQNNPKIVVTDGYHITKPLKLVYKDLHTYCFKVGCAISDRQLLFGFFVLAGLYLAGMFTGFVELKVLSFAPLLFLLFSYYVNRKEFIRLVPVVD